MTSTRQQATEILNDFHSCLEELITEKLAGRVTVSQVNNYYGYQTDCLITQLLREADELDQRLSDTLPQEKPQ